MQRGLTSICLGMLPAMCDQGLTFKTEAQKPAIYFCRLMSNKKLQHLTSHYTLNEIVLRVFLMSFFITECKDCDCKDFKLYTTICKDSVYRTEDDAF